MQLKFSAWKLLFFIIQVAEKKNRYSSKKKKKEKSELQFLQVQPAELPRCFSIRITPHVPICIFFYFLKHFHGLKIKWEKIFKTLEGMIGMKKKKKNERRYFASSNK